VGQVGLVAQEVEEETHEVAPEVLEARLTMAEGRG